jgi:hypothetical protein
MKYNTPKELWNLYKELQEFNKKKQDQEKIGEVVFDLLCAHLKEKEIRYTVSYPDDMIRWIVGFDDHRNGELYYHQHGQDYMLNAMCYRLKENDNPLDYVRLSNVFNSLLFRGKVYYDGNRKELRFLQVVSMHELYWMPEMLPDRLFQHYNTADDVSLCANMMYSTGKDPFDVVADFMSQRNQESAS